MMAKNPLDLQSKKFSKEELAEALRYAIIAELDAINLYLQFARSIEDERFKKVFEDIAKEEKTHVGEFLALLKTLDPEQVEEIASGKKEVEELTGISNIPDPPSDNEVVQAPEIFNPDEWSYFKEKINEVVNANRVLRKYLPVYNPGRGVEAVVVEEIEVGETISPKGRRLIPLEELSVKFSISQHMIDHARRRGEKPDFSPALYAAAKLGLLEDEYLVKQLLSINGALTGSISDWTKGGMAVEEVSQALSTLVKENIPGPYVLFISPARYSKLVMVHEKTGVMELTRLKNIVDEVVALKQLPDDTAILVSANQYMLDIAIGADTVLDYIGPENGSHVFRLWETLALRIKYPKAVMILKQG